MPLPAALRRQIDLQTLRDFAAELEASLDSGTLDEAGRQSATYHLKVARDSIKTLEQRQAPNRPARRFAEMQAVHTNDERTGSIAAETDDAVGRWTDGEWTYLVEFSHSDKLVRYAEHELTEAGR